MTIDIRAIRIKSFEKSTMIPDIDAPNTFLMLISLVRCSAMNDANPVNPSNAMAMVKMVKPANSLESRCSEMY